MAAPSRLESLNSLRNATADVAFATAFGTLISGSYIVGFIQHLGGSDVWIGLVTAIPALAGLLQIPGAAFGKSHESFKKFVQWGGGLWRLFHVPLIILALLPIPNELKLFLILVFVGLAGIATQFVSPTYNEWIGNLVPDRSRGWYFSQRTLVSATVGMIVGMIGAWILDQFKGTEYESQGFAFVFSLGIICALMSWIYFQKMSDLKRENVQKADLKSIGQVVKEPFQDKNFRKVMLFVGIFWIGASFPGNLFSAYALESLKMDFTVLQLTSVTHTLGTILTVKLWGWLADKYGNKPVLLLLLIGVSFTPIMWISTSPDLPAWQNAAILIGFHIFPGIFWSGIGVTTMNLYLATSTSEQRGNYLASALTVQAIVSFIAPIAGSSLMALLRAPLGPVDAYKWVFIVSMVGRAMAAVALIPVREHGAISLRETVKNLARVRPQGVAAMRAMRTVSDHRERESAIRKVGLSQFTLATDELVSALNDPSPRVRREAADALGRLKTEEASAALIQFIQEQPENVDEETLEALGNSPGTQNAEILIGFLADPSPILRRSAAKALGRLGDQRAAKALAEAARQPGDPDLRRAAIQALRTMESTEPLNYHDALFDNHPSVRTAAAEAVAELKISELAEPLRQSLEWLNDEGASETAYALGVVGKPEDISIIVNIAKHAVGITKIRRCLLGVASLMGVENEAYRMLTMEEVSRDNLLLQNTRPFIKKDKQLAKAIEAYSSGDEHQATEILCQHPQLQILLPLAKSQIPESFLVTVLVYLRKIT